jgi:hypothetical protein
MAGDSDEASTGTRSPAGSRRRFLRTLAAGSAGAVLAGCSALSGSDDSDEALPSDADDATPSATPTQSATAAPTATSAPTPTDAPTATPTDTATPTPRRYVDVPDEPRRSASQFDPSDGFADMAPWLDDDTAVLTVSEPTRAALARAVNQPVDRVIVFECSGTIDLQGERLEVLQGNCWIAGQTAPDPGITLTRGDVAIYGDDCVVQHLRVRPGDAGKETGWEPDGIRTGDGTDNAVVDHCSISWSVDENTSPGYESDRTTYTNCLVAEPLRDATHPKGEHNYSMLVGNNAKRVTVAGNLFVDGVDRNPRLKEGTDSVVVNNGVFHFGDGVWMDPDTRSSVEGNAYRGKISNKPTVFGDGEAHVADNDREADAPGPFVGEGITQLDSRPLWPDGLETLPSSETLDHDFRHAGARPVARTPHDRRILEKARSGNYAFVDSQTEVGGYPNLAENTRELAVPDSGLRAWLREHARAVEP